MPTSFITPLTLILVGRTNPREIEGEKTAEEALETARRKREAAEVIQRQWETRRKELARLDRSRELAIESPVAFVTAPHPARRGELRAFRTRRTSPRHLGFCR